jgi:hypothetical protein
MGEFAGVLDYSSRERGTAAASNAKWLSNSHIPVLEAGAAPIAIPVTCVPF